VSTQAPQQERTDCCEIQTDTACKCADEEDEVIALGILELIDHSLPTSAIDLASQKIVVKARD
jgi:hypothetical protein